MIRFYYLSFFLSLTALTAVADEYTDPVSNVVYTYDPEGDKAMVKTRPYYQDEDAATRLSGITGYSLNDHGVHGDVSILSHFIVNGKEYMVTEIGEGAFYYNSLITSVILPETLESIGSNAFQLCVGLKSVAISSTSTLKHIGGGAFGACSSLVDITIPESIETIESSAFYGCRNLKSVHIPATVKRIGDDVFCRCESLLSITVDEANTVYDSRRGAMPSSIVPLTC